MKHDELVKKLRGGCDANTAFLLCYEAADAITALQARVEELEEENAQYRVAKNSAGNIITQRQWNAMKQHRYTAESERDALRHDIARHVEICASQAQEVEELRTRLADAEALAIRRGDIQVRLQADLAAARADAEVWRHIAQEHYSLLRRARDPGELGYAIEGALDALFRGYRKTGKFSQVFCSQCGRAFMHHNYHGYSHCDEHNAIDAALAEGKGKP